MLFSFTSKHFLEVIADPDSLAFLIPKGNSLAPLPYNTYQQMLRNFGGKAGLETNKLSSHSLRRGGCTYLSMCGVALEEIKVCGDWTSIDVFAFLKTPLTIRIINDLKISAIVRGLAWFRYVAPLY